MRKKTRHPFSLVLMILLLSPVYSEGSDEKVLNVRWYGQTREEKWGENYLGTSDSLTLHTHGCALTAASMVLDYYDISINPSQLNSWLIDNDGFEDGWDDDSGEYLGKVRILWNIPAEGLDRIRSYKRIDFKDSPADTALIRSYLEREIPLIAEVLRPGGIPHFVVIYGYEEDRFLIRDPLDRETRYLSDQYHISDEYGSGPERNIFGLRIYEPVEP